MIKSYYIQPGDTIQSVAQQLLGNADQWTEIVSYNNLKFPYISSAPSDGALSVGDELLIPNDSYEILPENLSKNEKESITATVLGVDLDLTKDTDDVYKRGSTDELFEISSNKGILDTVSGYDNLKQALIMRLNTPKGSLLLHPEYGSDIYTYLGKKNTVDNVNKLKVSIEQTLRSDSRVSSAKVKTYSVSQESVTFTVTFIPMSFEDQVSFILGLDDDKIAKVIS